MAMSLAILNQIQGCSAHVWRPEGIRCKESKVIVAALGFIVSMAPMVGLNVDFLTPEVQTAIVTATTAILVWAIPNGGSA